MLKVIVLLCLIIFDIVTLSYNPSYRSYRNPISINSNRDSSNSNSNNIVESLSILKNAALNKNGDVKTVKCAIENISNSNSKLLRSDVSLISGEYELVFSSILPFGYFPIKEVVNFLPYFKLTSSFINIPFGEFEGVSTVKSKAPAEITFYNKLFRFGQFEFPINKITEKTYRFLHIDDEYIVALSLGSSSASASGTLLRKL